MHNGLNVCCKVSIHSLSNVFLSANPSVIVDERSNFIRLSHTLTHCIITSKHTHSQAISELSHALCLKQFL